MVFRNGVNCCQAMRANFWLLTERKKTEAQRSTPPVENVTVSVPQPSVLPRPPMEVVTQPPPMLMTKPPYSLFCYGMNKVFSKEFAKTL